MAFRSLLVPTDLSPLSDRVLNRVALLPLAPRARVTLLHVVPPMMPLGAERRAARDAKQALAEARAQVSALLPRDTRVDTLVEIESAPKAIAATARATDAELVVMGRGSPRGLRDAFIGSTAERVIRMSLVPVLAVRTPARTAYRRPLVALDTDEGANHVISLLLRLLPAPRPSVSVVHAFDVPFRQLRYPHVSEEDFSEVRDHYRQQAMVQLTRVLGEQLPADERARWRLHAKFGNPRAVVLKAAKQEHADLLALATHGYGGVAHAFLGTVAGDVLRHVSCDVLIVPPRRVDGAND